MTGTSSVRYALQGHVAVISIDRPDARNAVNAEVARGLEEAVDRLESDDNVWLGILTGVPPVFCAGADLKEIAAGRQSGLRTQRGGFAGFTARHRIKPVIAAVDGPALAGGTEICLACDLIVASTTATFGIPEVKRGLVAAAGGLFRLPRRVPLNLAMEMALTGGPLNAERAYRVGLVNRLVAPGEALLGALDLAREVEANAPLAVRASRRLVLESLTAEDATNWSMSSAAMAEMIATEDSKEGIAAFVAKRSPKWTAR